MIWPSYVFEIAQQKPEGGRLGNFGIFLIWIPQIRRNIFKH